MRIRFLGGINEFDVTLKQIERAYEEFWKEPFANAPYAHITAVEELADHLGPFDTLNLLLGQERD